MIAISYSESDVLYRFSPHTDSSESKNYICS